MPDLRCACAHATTLDRLIVADDALTVTTEGLRSGLGRGGQRTVHPLDRHDNCSRLELDPMPGLIERCAALRSGCALRSRGRRHEHSDAFVAVCRLDPGRNLLSLANVALQYNGSATCSVGARGKVVEAIS